MTHAFAPVGFANAPALPFRPYEPPSPLLSGDSPSHGESPDAQPSPPFTGNKARKLVRPKDSKISKHMSCSACRRKKTRCDRRENCGSPTSKTVDDFPDASTAAQREIARLRTLVSSLATRLGLDPQNPILSPPTSPVPEQGPSPPSSLDSPIVSYAALSVGDRGNASTPPDSTQKIVPPRQIDSYPSPLFPEDSLDDDEPERDVKPFGVFSAQYHESQFDYAVEETGDSSAVWFGEETFEARRMWPGASMPPFRGETMWG
ncbi:hypothetical protein RQP46_002633 [Phenoliferia psychrophenolica]